MGKRAFDIAVAAVGLVLMSPVMAAAAAALRLTSRGPVVYRAERIGKGGRPFTMHKFRTMRVAEGARITGTRDDRVLKVGRWLRATKIDELPQLWDVLRGAMSIVGPRPEDPEMVRRHYSPAMMRTLDVRPGITSPGAIFGTIHADELLDADDAEAAYVERMLPMKLALELVYMERQSLRYDIEIIGRTVAVVARMVAGRKDFPDLPEMALLKSREA